MGPSCGLETTRVRCCSRLSRSPSARGEHWLLSTLGSGVLPWFGEAQLSAAWTRSHSTAQALPVARSAVAAHLSQAVSDPRRAHEADICASVSVLSFQIVGLHFYRFRIWECLEENGKRAHLSPMTKVCLRCPSLSPPQGSELRKGVPMSSTATSRSPVAGRVPWQGVGCWPMAQ